jgi:sec-independent protein translocase protein TatC
MSSKSPSSSFFDGPFDQQESPASEQEQGINLFDGASYETLSGHMKELRERLLKAALAILLAIILSFFAVPSVLTALKWLAPKGVIFVQLEPGEVLFLSFRTALILGLFLASPFWLYQVGRFLWPALKPKECQALGWSLLLGGGLFTLGVAFAWATVLPLSLEFLFSYGAQVAENQVSIARYIEFVLLLLALVGLMFELPLVLILLALTNLVSSKGLMAHWREVAVGILVLAALLTPTQDPVTMLLIGAALLALYGGSLIGIKLLRK